MYINPAYFNKTITSFVNDLIQDYDYKSYDDLSQCDKYEFASYMIEACGSYSELEFLTESNDSDQTINAYKQALRDGSDLDFTTILKNNTVRYFDKSMRTVFNEIKADNKRDSSPRYDETYNYQTGVYL